MREVKESKVLELLDTSMGRIFSVEFVKRTTGEVRSMQCRQGVHSYLRGGEPAYDRYKANVVCVFDVGIKAYRSIPLEGLRTISLDGESYMVDHTT